MLGNLINANYPIGSTGTSFFAQLRRVIGTSYVEMIKKFNSLVNIVSNTVFNVSDP